MPYMAMTQVHQTSTLQQYMKAISEASICINKRAVEYAYSILYSTTPART